MRAASHLTPWLCGVLVLLAGCAPGPRLRVVLLPQEDGSRSAVQVQVGPLGQRLATPYQRLVVARSGVPVVDQAVPADIARDFEPLFATRPSKPRRFVVYFESGEASLTPASQATLTEVLALAETLDGLDMVVVGHTDSTGDPADNDALSLRRATQVRKLLLQRQLFVLKPFPGRRIEAVGRGDREPAVRSSTGGDEPLNRRVEILLR